MASVDTPIRRYRDDDLAAVYDICVRTADNAFVVDLGDGPVGYVIGTSDTPEFVRRYREVWIPKLSDRYPEPAGDPSTPDEVMIALHYWPERMLVPEVASYPAHLHIDLLPDVQGKGYGRALMAAMFKALAKDGAPAVHVGMVTANTRARGFYDRLGFHVIPVPDPGPLTYLGRSTR